MGRGRDHPLVWTVCAVLAFGLLESNSCDRSSTPSTPPAPPESSKVRITSPTTSSTWTVGGNEVQLSGTAAIDAWGSTIEPNVRWRNITTGTSNEAAEFVDWLWFFGWFPTNHTWQASVPLASGWNVIHIEAYYSDLGSIMGVDSIEVHAP